MQTIFSNRHHRPNARQREQRSEPFFGRRAGAPVHSQPFYQPAGHSQGVGYVQRKIQEGGEQDAFYRPSGQSAYQAHTNMPGLGAPVIQRRCADCPAGENSELQIQRLTLDDVGETLGGMASGIVESVSSFFGDARERDEEVRSIPRHRPEQESNSDFCKPYTSSTEAIAAKIYLAGVLPAASAGMFGGEVSSLWVQYLRGPSSRRFYGNGTTIGQGFATNTIIRERVYKLMEIAAGRPHLYATTAANTWEEIPVTHIFTADEIKNPLNFNNPFDIPGHIAGGSGSSDKYGADTRRLTGTLRVYRAVDGDGETQYVKLESNFGFEVRDTVDFCPGDSGTGYEEILTIPLSRLEATGLAWDVPFQVDFSPTPVTTTLPGTVFASPPGTDVPDIDQPEDRRGRGDRSGEAERGFEEKDRAQERIANPRSR